MVEHLKRQLSFMTQLIMLKVGTQTNFRSGLVYPDYFSPFRVNAQIYALQARADKTRESRKLNPYISSILIDLQLKSGVS